MTIEGCVLSSERIRHLKCPAAWLVLEGAPGPEQAREALRVPGFPQRWLRRRGAFQRE